ncbi:MAG TPA: Hsp20/alpha crystallin family protein [Sphingomicrobium sp.]|nr:Hsp20/alpha crystallin family protein [Sphingomicrobium sp.]
MTMQDLTPFGRQQTTLPAFWHDYEALPFGSFRREIGQLFDNLFRTPAYGYGYSGKVANWPVIDFKDFDTEVVVTAEVPGLTEKDVELFFDKGILTFRGEKKGEKQETGYSEMFYGRFERQIPLPYSLDAEHCTAEFRDGLLTVHLPKLAEVENKKKIPISVETRH